MKSSILTYPNPGAVGVPALRLAPGDRVLHRLREEEFEVLGVTGRYRPRSSSVMDFLTVVVADEHRRSHFWEVQADWVARTPGGVEGHFARRLAAVTAEAPEAVAQVPPSLGEALPIPAVHADPVLQRSFVVAARAGLRHAVVGRTKRALGVPVPRVGIVFDASRRVFLAAPDVDAVSLEVVAMFSGECLLVEL